MRKLVAMFAWFVLGVLSAQAQTSTGVGTVNGTATIPISSGGGGGGGSSFPVGWTILPNTNYAPLCPNASGLRPDVQGTTGCRAVIVAWAGGCADLTTNQLVFDGGGHHDYKGNEKYSLDLDSRVMAVMNRASDASTVNDNTTNYDVMPDGSMGARHTYGGVTCAHGNMFHFGGGVIGPGALSNGFWKVQLSCLSPGATPAACDQHITPTLSGGSFSAPVFGDMFEHNPFDDNYYLLMPFSLSDPGQLWRYTDANTTFTLLNTNGSVGTNADQSGVIDPIRNQFWQIGANHVIRSSLSSSFVPANVTLNANCNPFISPAYPGLAFDYVDHNIVIYPNSPSPVGILNPDTLSCSSETYTGGPNTFDSDFQGTFGRFRAFPQLGGFAVCNSSSSNCGFLRRTVDFALNNNWTNRISGVNVPGGAANVVSSFDLYTPPTTTIQHYVASSFGNGSISNDTTTHTSDGTGSLHWHMNAGAFQGEPGTYNYNFNSTNSALYGPGSEFYIQLRVRYSPEMIQSSTWDANFEGSKIFFISEGDSATSGQTGGCSNTPTDTVIQNGASRVGYLINYWNCGVAGTLRFLDSGFEPVQLFGPSLPGPSGNFLDQVATGCPHYTGFAGMPNTDPPCFNFAANEWFTLQIHVKWGGNNTADSAEDLWAAHEGQPAVLVNNAFDMAIRDLGGSITDKFGKITLGPYATNAHWLSAADVWYCCIEVANRRIPDPDVNTPQPPDSLFLSAISASSITVNWRVNSSNGYPQDDSGFVVERCTNTTAQCMGNQSPWTQVGSITAPHATSFVDNTVSAGHTYVYRVKARNQFGDSGYAKSICFNTGGNCGGTATI